MNYTQSDWTTNNHLNIAGDILHDGSTWGRTPASPAPEVSPAGVSREKKEIFLLLYWLELQYCFVAFLVDSAIYSLSFMEVIFYITLKIKWNISDVVMSLLQSSVPWSTISHGWLKVHIFTSQIMPAFFTFLYLIKQDLVESNQSTNHWLWCRCNKKYNHCHDVKRINLIVSIKWP